MELSFSELRCKEVINLTDGKRLGRPIDLVFDQRARIRGIVTPSPQKGVFWRKSEDILIPWNCITKIGDDVILVKLGGAPPPPPPPLPPPCPPDKPCSPGCAQGEF